MQTIDRNEQLDETLIPGVQMSLQAGIRRKGRSITWSWEGRCFGYAFELFEQIRSELNVPNLHTFADNEMGPEFDLTEEEIEAFEESLPEDVEDDPEELLIRERGEWHDPAHAVPVVAAYVEFLEGEPAEREFATSHGRVKCADLAEELRSLRAELEGDQAPFRIYVG